MQSAHGAPRYRATPDRRAARSRSPAALFGLQALADCFSNDERHPRVGGGPASPAEQSATPSAAMQGVLSQTLPECGGTATRAVAFASSVGSTAPGGGVEPPKEIGLPPPAILSKSPTSLRLIKEYSSSQLENSFRGMIDVPAGQKTSPTPNYAILSEVIPADAPHPRPTSHPASAACSACEMLPARPPPATISARRSALSAGGVTCGYMRLHAALSAGGVGVPVTACNRM